MFKTDKLLTATAVAVLLPLIAASGPALAGSPRASNVQTIHSFGDPDSGGELRPRVPDGTIVHGPGGGKPPTVPHVVRPMMVADDGPVVITGPGGTKPPTRPRVFEPTILASDGPPIIRGGGGGGKPPTRPARVSLAMDSNDGTTVSGPGGSGKPPTRPHIVGSANAA